MRRGFLGFILILAAVAVGAEELELGEVLERYAAARGGERWVETESLQLTGTYATFSERAAFSLIRRRGDLYRLDHTLLGAPAVRARDGEGPWALHKLLSPEAARITEGPYKGQMERESLFGPLLLRHAEDDVEVSLIGRGEVDGVATIDLEVELASGRTETWHLDGETFLEFAVDSEVYDFTQLPKPMLQRTFFDDFRDVDGLVVPFFVELEFGARLESMQVETVEVNPAIADSAFSPPS